MEEQLCQNFEFLSRVCSYNGYDFEHSQWQYPYDARGNFNLGSIGLTGPIGPSAFDQPNPVCPGKTGAIDPESLRIRQEVKTNQALTKAMHWLIKRQALDMLTQVIDYLLAAEFLTIEHLTDLLAQTEAPAAQELLQNKLAELEWSALGGTKAA